MVLCLLLFLLALQGKKPCLRSQQGKTLDFLLFSLHCPPFYLHLEQRNSMVKLNIRSKRSLFRSFGSQGINRLADLEDRWAELGDRITGKIVFPWKCHEIFDFLKQNLHFLYYFRSYSPSFSDFWIFDDFYLHV